MKNLDEIKDIIKKHKPELLEKYYLNSMNIFGSFSKKKETSKSDVDILVEIDGQIGGYFI
ncbi:MAG: hypothetical protein GF383_11945 [Candidatus Lokiarchaeota archaeon]|nr:hypothetical protein [Candidatus Lokiarchaeota archaeon]MBD3341586.1 hypothetical protein [Candidatus Lokiarchaeota archaeon]